jgi:transposase
MTKSEQARLVAWRAKLLAAARDETRTVAKTCRHFGISRQAFYKWKKRYDTDGDSGLCDRSRAPHRSPRATSKDVVSKVLYLRQTYHFGPGKIADYLKRFHQTAIARSTVHRLLIRHGLNRLPGSQKHRPLKKRWLRYEKPQPGHRVQIDVKFLERLPNTGKRLYQFTAIDDCTRVRVLKVFDACNQRTAIQFINNVRHRLPFRILTVQTDNGAEFQTQFHGHLHDLNIRHVYIARARRISTARWSARTAWTTRSFTNCWTRMASPTISICSMRSCGSGRTTTITTDLTERSAGKPRTNGSSQKPKPERQRTLRTLHFRRFSQSATP